MLQGAGIVPRALNDPARIADALAAALSARPVDEAVACLSHAGVPAVRARRVSELFHDPRLMAAEFAHFRRSDTGSIMSTPGRYSSFSRTPRWGPMFPPGIGEHSRDVLQSAGLSPGEIDALLAAGVIREGGPMAARFGVAYR